jgi:outer membrane biosynthesis protein TonB
MSIHMRNPYEAPESSINTRMLLDLILLSLLAHAAIITAILLITVFMPIPKIVVPKPASPAVSLSLMPPPVKPTFIPTTPQANVPHKVQPVISANDTELASQNKTPRNPESIMPDVNGKENAPNLTTSPSIRAPPKPEVSSTPPTPKQTKPEKPTPPQPPQPAPKPRPPTPPQKPRPQVDANGLPVLPPLNVPTMVPQDQAAQPLAPAQSPAQEAASVHGALGRHGDTSPAAMATALGKYKQKVYRQVGSYWYPKVDKSFQVLGVGEVRVQYTIHSDGSVETRVLNPGDGTTQMLLSISINSIREAAPFDKFEDYPGLREEIIKEQGGDGGSYTDDFTFSIYGR